MSNISKIFCLGMLGLIGGVLYDDIKGRIELKKLKEDNEELKQKREYYQKTYMDPIEANFNDFWNKWTKEVSSND